MQASVSWTANGIVTAEVEVIQGLGSGTWQCGCPWRANEKFGRRAEAPFQDPSCAAAQIHPCPTDWPVSGRVLRG